MNMLQSLIQLSGSLTERPDPDTLAAFERARELYFDVSRLIEAFNPEIARGFLAFDPAPLRPLTTRAGYERIEKNYKTWREGSMTRLDLVKVELLSINEPTLLDGSPYDLQTQALTAETWKFHYVDGTTRLSDSLDLYTLVHCESGWLVERVEFHKKG